MSNEITLTVYKRKQEGELVNKYSPLYNLVDGSLEEENKIKDFEVSGSKFKIDLNNPLNIECQPSYDGTVNLIINDDKNPPRLINTRFSKIEDNRFKIINRNQLQQTNLYEEDKVDEQTRLFRNINSIPRIELEDVHSGGQLKGGNYTFYLKFADNDYNKTDVVAESGQISVFKGDFEQISSISGTLFDELTDKAISLRIDNIDASFSKMYLYYTRETSDLNGVRLTKAGFISKPYDIFTTSQTITIDGFEEIDEISPEEINIQYNLVTSVKTQTQVQNMLFFGNVKGTDLDLKELQNISYFVKVTLKQDKDVGYVDPKDYSVADRYRSEYYNPLNTYYKLGYWPDEIYRLGIVYIMNDDSLSPVFNLRGCEFTGITNDAGIRNCNIKSGDSYETYKNNNKIQYLPRNEFLNDNLYNTLGVFKNPSVNIWNETNKTKPLYYSIEFTSDVITALQDNGVKGYFIVRQKRIPTIICQGLSVGIDRTSYIPMLYYNNEYIAESFLSESCALTQSFANRLLRTQRRKGSGLLSLDVMTQPQLQGNFDGSDFVLKPAYNDDSCELSAGKTRSFYVEPGSIVNPNLFSKATCTFIDSDTPLKYINGYGFSTRCGSAEDVSLFSFFERQDNSKSYSGLIRGIYCPFIGVNSDLKNNMIYNIKVPGYSEALMRNYFLIRGNDNSPFYAVTHRYDLSHNTVDVFRGDCFTNTVTIRINRNFVDPEVPLNDIIVDPNTWSENYKGYFNTLKSSSSNDKSAWEEDEDDGKGDYTSINRADVNAVGLGMWVTFKCLSNYNLGLRSQDSSHIDEQALMGSPRKFYPLIDKSVLSSHKIEESRLLNQGYGATVSQKRNYAAENVPYVKELFDNRIMFSNVQQEDSFKNAYRIFQGLSFKDIDRQYGAIVKLLPWGSNLLCIFEHGIGLIPINEKALIATNSGQSIHMYGAGVLQNQITPISQDFGSIWQESIIRTPKGVYGVDTYAKKIWRCTPQGVLETISDMKVQQFLNDHIILDERDKYPIISLRNVKTHYNNYKGDVMFTFYNNKKDETWNLCFNERMDKWITRYSWTPLYSENIDNIFYSVDQKRAKILATIYNNKNCTYGIRTNNNKWTVSESDADDPDSFYTITLETVGLPWSNVTYTINSAKTSYIDSDSGEETFDELNANDLSDFMEVEGNTIKINRTELLGYYGLAPAYFIIDVSVTVNNSAPILTDSVGIIIEDPTNDNQRSIILRNGFYIHGRAGIFNELNYRDSVFTNQILPTNWYGKQEPFEFEFVVNGDVGLHKIFDNLVIISNNVQPNEIEYEIIGDVYNFNKANIYRQEHFGESEFTESKESTKPGIVIPKITQNDINPERPTGQFKSDITKPRITGDPKKYQSTQELINCSVGWDDNLNTYSLILKQPCKNIEQFGRRLGNIHYKEDTWYVTIDPIMYKEKYMIDGDPNTETEYGPIKSARLRDKFIKIRVKYTGEDVVIITALKTLLTLSYA